MPTIPPPMLIQFASLKVGSILTGYTTPASFTRITSLALAENVKRQLTKQLQLEVDVRNIEQEMVSFLEENIKKHPGKSSLKIVVSEPKNRLRFNLVSMETGLEMNTDLIQFLETKPEIDVLVTPVG